MTQFPSWTTTRWVSPDAGIAALAVLASHGFETAPALQEAELPLDFEASPQLVSYQSASIIWRYVSRKTGDPAVGIRAAQLIAQRPMGLHGYLMQTSPTLRHALLAAERVAPLQDELARCELIEVPEGVCFAFRGSCTYYHPVVAEFTAARMVSALRRIVSPSMHPTKVCFVHEAQGPTTLHREFFRSNVEFQSDVFGLVYRRDELDHPIATHDAALHALLCEHAEHKLTRLSHPRSTSERVYELIVHGWQQGRSELPTRTEIARTLKVTPRTLARWLVAEGKTYSDIVEEFRLVTATRHLQDGQFPIDRLSQLLGFEDQSSFSRAFRRWTGMTPGQYRRLHGSGTR